MTTLVRFLRCEVGATSIEYGLIAAGISIGIVAIVNGLGTVLSGKYSSFAAALK
jgi:pilus assembly protein Flp/PilA